MFAGSRLILDWGFVVYISDLMGNSTVIFLLDSISGYGYELHMYREFVAIDVLLRRYAYVS